MLEELRLNPRSPGKRSYGRGPGVRGITENGTVDPRLSTGFADGALLRSTGQMPPIHRPYPGLKEVVG